MAGNTLRINNGSVAVTPIVAAYCQKAAKKAAKREFSVKEIKHVGRYIRKSERRGGNNRIK